MKSSGRIGRSSAEGRARLKSGGAPAGSAGIRSSGDAAQSQGGASAGSELWCTPLLVPELNGTVKRTNFCTGERVAFAAAGGDRACAVAGRLTQGAERSSGP